MLIDSEYQNFDIIGDVHGCAHALERLLNKLGYQEIEGVYQHSSCASVSNQDNNFKTRSNVAKRQAIFVGDIIDRGPDILRCLQIVRAMVEGGHAHLVLGNHEFNAIAYFTPLDDGFLRARNVRSNQQIQATLDAFKGDQTLLNDYLAWFSSLPLFLEFDQLRVVHACWDQKRIDDYVKAYRTHCLTAAAIDACGDYTSAAARAVERLTRGLSLRLPDNMSITGKDGFKRASFRVRFWSPRYHNYSDIVFQPDPLPESIRERALDSDEKKRLIHYSEQEKPLFIGHYWLQGEPKLVASNVVCLDYSAVNEGKLVAYCFDANETYLSNENFVYVDSSAAENS